MSDTQLTTISTLAWLVGTATMFILLAHWSAVGAWGISSAIARGLAGWSGRDAGLPPGGSELSPMQMPRLDRLWGADRRTGGGANRSGRPMASEPTAEMEDLGARRLP